MAFLAQYPGTCCECDERFVVGEMIESVAGQFGMTYRHAVECPEAKEPKPTRFQGTTLEEMGFD